jgi:hypothetical protein
VLSQFAINATLEHHRPPGQRGHSQSHIHNGFPGAISVTRVSQEESAIAVRPPQRNDVIWPSGT